MPMTIRGRTSVLRLWALRMKWESIFSVISKSAMTPSFMGRIADDVARRAAQHLLGFLAHGLDLAGERLTATIDGSETTIPLPLA